MGTSGNLSSLRKSPSRPRKHSPATITDTSTTSTELDQHHTRQPPSRAVKPILFAADKASGRSRSHVHIPGMAQMARTSPRRGGSYSSPASSDDGRNVKYTKTGRVSKALKGRPVHKCDVCEKCYTRAEHLRRHQLNHKGARPWLCDVPGCEKSLPNRGFYREDLLLRHIEDHKNASSDPASDSSYLNDHHRGLSNHSRVDLSDAYRRSPSVFSDNPLGVMNHMTTAEMMAGSSYGTSCDTSYTPSLGAAYSPLVSHSLQTPSLYSSPAPEHSTYQPYFLGPAPALDGWNHSQFDLNRSGSPASVVSSFNIPAWHETDQKPRMFMMSPPESDQSTFAPADTSYGANGHEPDLHVSPGMMTAADFDVMDEVRINKDIASLPSVNEPQAPTRFQALQQLYLPAFWKDFYPTFPIIHRPTFNSSDNIPPLLKALMTAIGASYVNETSARNVARVLRCTCDALVEKRPSYLLASSRIWDLHIVLLAEVFSLFRSRRPATRLSPRFETLCATLQFDTAVSASKTPEDLAPMEYSPDEETAMCIRNQWIENESKRRIFLACYVLEAQRASLFQQSRSISDDNLPFTCSTPLWEARDVRAWSELAKRESYNPQCLEHALHRQSSVPYDTFTAAIVTAYVTNSQHPIDTPPQGLDSIVPHPRNALSYHAMMLANSTPVRDLLAVSGDSFVFSEKLGAAQYEQAYVNLRMWLGSSDAVSAMFHAAKMLKTAYDSGRCGLLHEEWALYVAALVCWAHGMWERGQLAYARHASPSLGLDEQMSSFLARFEIDGADAAAGGYIGLTDWMATRACLAWVQARISGQIGGLLEDAVTVLDKLATNRGS